MRLRKHKVKAFFKLYTPITLVLIPITLYILISQVNIHKRKIKQTVNNNLFSRAKSFESTLLSHIHNTTMVYKIAETEISSNSEIKAYKNLSKILSDFILEYKCFDHVRLVDFKGNELIRVNFEDGKSQAINSELFQNKSHRPYFKRVINNKGQILISELDLNIENKKTEYPLKPAIRFSYTDTTLYSPGIVILNLNSKSIIDEIIQESQIPEEQFFLLNQKGHWIIGPDSTFYFSKYTKTGKQTPQFNKLYNKEWKHFGNKKQGQFETVNGHYSFIRISLHQIPNAPENILAQEDWIIVSIIPLKNLHPPWLITTISILIFFTISITLGLYAWVNFRTDIYATIDSLKESDDKLSSITESVKEGIILINQQGQIHFWSKSAQNLFGYSTEEVKDHSLYDKILTKQSITETENWNKLFSQSGNLTSKSNELIAITKHNIEFPVEISINKIKLQNSWGAVAVVRDITEQKQAQQSLIDSQKTYKSLVNNLPGIVYKIDLHTNKILFISMDVSSFYRESNNRHQNKDQELIHSSIYQSDLQKVKDAKKKAIDSSSSYEIEYRMYLPDQKLRWCLEKGVVVNQNCGNQYYLEAYISDISLRKESELKFKELNKELEKRVGQRTKELQKANKAAISIMQDANMQKSRAEEALKQLQQSTLELRKLSSAIEQSPTIVIITDNKGRIEYVNPKFTQVTGFSRKETKGKTPSFLNAGIMPKEYYTELWKTILAGQEWHGELCNKKKNGEIFWEMASISPVRSIKGTITNFVAVKENITEQRKSNIELERMARFAEQNPAPVTRFDQYGNLLLANKCDAKIYSTYSPCHSSIPGN